MKILSVLLEEVGSPVKIAKKLDITKNAVYGWTNESKRHPSNEHVQNMLEILKKEDKDKLSEILVEELQKFQELIFEF